MWRFIDQLVKNLRGGRLDREAKALRPTRLAIETLETRTVLSANFGVDYEAQTYFEFTAPPPPRFLVAHESTAAITTAFAEDAPPMFAEDRLSAGSAEGASYVVVVRFQPDRREMNQGWSVNKPPLGSMWYGHRSLAAAASLEDGPFNSLSVSNEGPLRGQAPTSAKGDVGANNIGNHWFASSFDPPQASSLEALLEQAVETRHVTTSPFVAPISDSTSDDVAELVDSASLLATYATLAASIDDSLTTSHDAAFDGYSTLRDGDADREQYLQLLAEDQTRDAAGGEAGGFADLDEARIDDAEDLSNMAADNQREAVESALRSLAERRSDARTSLLPENWLEQAWLTTEIEQDAASANQVTDEPGGMILLPPMADGAGDELIAAGDVDEVIKTAVEMEATIGTFQAFDVSVDEAPAAVAKPAPTNELGAKQERDASTAEATTERQAASGLGVVAVGAMALIAKRKIDDRRRKPKSTA